MSNDVLYGLNVDIKCRIAYKILLKCDLLGSKDFFFTFFIKMLVNYMEKALFLLKLAHNIAHN